METPTNQRPRSILHWSLILLLLVTIIISLIGGGILGGIAGYIIALNRPVQALSIPEPSTISIPASSLAPTSPALTPPQRGGMLVAPENEALVAAVERVKPATVTVLNFIGRRRISGSGSGVIIDKAGYIATNYHVVEGARRLEIIFSHGGGATAQLVGISPEFDLAVVKVDAEHVPAVANFGDSAALKQGERVAAIGSALGGFRNTVTSGVISAHNRSLGEQNGLLQTDTPINHGNSGGPLINLQGEVIGINVMVLRGNIGGDIAEGLGFSIPSNTARMIVKQLIEKGEVELPFLGVQYSDLNPQLSREYNLSVVTGSLITEVIPRTAAASANLQSMDILLAVDGQVIDDAHPLRQLLLEHEAGETVTLTVVRGNEQFDLTVTLGARPRLR